MNIDSKAAVILLCTLALGGGVGAVVTGAVARHRDTQLQALRRPVGFVEHMETLIQPHDSAQRAAIHPLLEEVAQRNDSIIRGAHDQLHGALDELRSRLAPLLDAAQRGRVAEEGRGPPGRPDQRGPDPFGPPGPPGRGGPGGRGPDGRGPPPPPGRGPPPP